MAAPSGAVTRKHDMSRSRASSGQGDATPEEHPAASAGEAAGHAERPGAAKGESFESAAERLGAIVAELESGELPLEQSLRLFEEGIKLARAAQKRLDEAEQKVEELLGTDAEGEPVTGDFEG